MPPASEIGNSPLVQPPTGGEHGDHGAGAAAQNGGTGQSFPAALAQAMSAALAGGHGGHGDAGGGTTSAFGANGVPHSGAHNMAASVPNGGADPRHFPIGGANHGEDHGFQEMALGLRAYRQQLIASNIANADTPHYKAVDIDFREAVRIAQATMAASVDLATTDSRHIAGMAQSMPHGVPLKYHVPQQPSADGNTVDMDVERAKFAENAVMYEFSLDRVKGHYKMMQEMLNNLPG